MKVTLVPYGIIPKATVSLAVDAGEINEGSAHVGVAGLTADLYEGRHGDAALPSKWRKRPRAWAARLDIGAGADQTNLSLDVLAGVRARWR